MNKILIISLALFGLSACDNHDHSSHSHSKEEHMQMMKDQASAESTVKVESATYVCPMHPHIHGKKGDTCPICNMNLVPQETNFDATDERHQNNNADHSMHNSKADTGLAASISNTKIQNVNVKTADVLFGEIKQEYTAFARVVSQNKAAVAISMRDNGWVENTANLEEFDQVKKGDFLFEFYSDQLNSAVINYIIALQQGIKAEITSAEVRLKNLGVQEQAINDLKTNKKVTRTTKFYSPIDGYIKTNKIQQGQNLKSGEVAMLIQPTEELWLNAFIAKDKLALTKNATIQLVNNAGSAILQNILPELDQQTQNYIARLKIEQTKLKNGDFIDVKFISPAKQGLIVPKSAILNDSSHNYVFVQNNNTFNAVMVKTAEFNEQNIIITSGLNEHDKVVVNGQFLIDSEAKLQSSFSSMSGHKH